MDIVARFNDEDRRDLFAKTAEQLQMLPAIIEKDFWVCWTLDALFSSPQWCDKMIFKGGTSLSKAFHVINIFSDRCFAFISIVFGGSWPKRGLAKLQIIDHQGVNRWHIESLILRHSF